MMADACRGTPVDVQRLERRQRRMLAAVMPINLGGCAMMLAAALYSGSSSLLSGMLDSPGDALAYLPRNL